MANKINFKRIRELAHKKFPTNVHYGWNHPAREKFRKMADAELKKAISKLPKAEAQNLLFEVYNERTDLFSKLGVKTVDSYIEDANSAGCCEYNKVCKIIDDLEMKSLLGDSTDEEVKMLYTLLSSK